jgi:predicted permease
MFVWLSDLHRDVRHGIRLLLRNPGFSLIAAASLALGIGGATAVFTVINAVVLRTLPVDDPHTLFVAQKHRQQESSAIFSWPVFESARDEVRGRAELAAATTSTTMQIRMAGQVGPGERGAVQLVSGEYFPLLRQRAQVGRLLTDHDNRTPGGHPVAVVSDGFWTRQFRRAPDIVGRDITINGVGFEIVGVAPKGFFGTSVGLRTPDVWIPLMMQPTVRYAANASSSGDADGNKPWPPQASIEWVNVFARVPRDADPAGIASAIGLVWHRDAAARVDADDEEGRKRLESERLVLEPAGRGLSALREEISTPLFVLLAMVAVLLAIACGNLASLLLARASARDREIAVRLSIGASRSRIVRQLLAETLLLSAGGCALGLLLAAWGADLLVTLFSTGATINTLDMSQDWRVLGFATTITVLTAIVTGTLPALRGTRVALTEALKLQARVVSSGGHGRLPVGKLLVAAQIALCLLLLVTASLCIRSLRTLVRSDIGFDRARVLTARMDVRSMGLTPEERQTLYDRVLDRLRSLPGVVSASASMNGPLIRSQRISSLSVEGYTRAPGERLNANGETVTDEYFQTVGLRLVDGRLFGPEDRAPGRRSTIINETMARRFFPGTSAVGKRWSYGGPITERSFVIVGVVRDAKYTTMRQTPPSMTYQLAVQSPDDVLNDLEARTTLAPDTLIAGVRQAIAEVEPRLPLYDLVPLEERINRGVSFDRLVASLTSAFGAIALLLACLGLYGTISYGVTRRVPEIGVRMALGASRPGVLWLVLREALVMVVAGACLGVPLAYAAGRGLRSLLYGIPPGDPVSFAIASAGLLAVATVAAFLPAWRASRIDPMVALRQG